MNTVKSVYYGWGALIVAGGGAYYFAKKSINADRAAKAEAEHKKRLAQYELESASFGGRKPTNSQQPLRSSIPSTPASKNDTITSQLDKAKRDRQKQGNGWQDDEDGSPSHEASMDPAPTRHAPEDENQKTKEKSKYEATDVYRSRKGDRFS